MTTADNPSIQLNSTKTDEDIVLYVKLKLAAMGYHVDLHDAGDSKATKFIDLSNSLIKNFQEKSRLLSDRLNPADQRIQDFLHRYFNGVAEGSSLKLPTKTFVLDQPGLARATSLPLGEHTFSNQYINSYKIKQGILNNPKNDRRTTKGSFHIVEGELPVPPDKKETPKVVFTKFLKAAFTPPTELMTFPFTQNNPDKIELFISLLLRPLVCPEVKGVTPAKTMEVRFFAPGSLVSNLDFVESIFGNAGDPALAENDAGLDIDHWTGHTGCIILAPHLTQMRKKDLGLPNVKDATPRQKRDGMYWQSEDELYNDGSPFKMTCRDQSGVVITLIADNYFGYSKKEIKTQISYAANLYGLCEEEHAGGALVFPRKSIQSTFYGDLFTKKFETPYSFETIKKNFGDIMHLQPENYGIDKQHPRIIYIPENAHIDIYDDNIKWNYQGKEHKIMLSPDNFYVHPTGHKLRMEKHPIAGTWELISTDAEGTVCHKPCTVSGGGKSEISKAIDNAINFGPFYVQNLNANAEQVEQILNYDYSNRWKDSRRGSKSSRALMSPDRTLGSVIKLLTPSNSHTDEYNSFLDSIPYQVKALVFFIKMFFRKERHTHWRDYISVNNVNGQQGHSLLFNRRKVTASYLRVGFDRDSSWYLHTLRPDFMPSSKIQLEDDITASVVLPANRLPDLPPNLDNKSVKIVGNCEWRFFQRPDDAIIRGYDRDAEQDLTQQNLFITNFQPLPRQEAENLINSAVSFDEYTSPVQELIREVQSDQQVKYFITPSHPRLVDGKPTKNPRYLQSRLTPDSSIDARLAEIGCRFSRNIPLNRPIHFPVNSILPSRRNNPQDLEAGIRPLSVYNPIHYQELPELFMDFICSLTGKSPSTTGAGSEGALTKGPFNMLVATTDLNNALLSNILTEYPGFTSAAGYVGDLRFDHDISILVPEIWSRLTPQARTPHSLIEEGSLEKLDDFDHQGVMVLASRLGYRITETFLFNHMNAIFDDPQAVFTKEMLQPELQNMDAFVDGINNIVEAQRTVALNYFEDGSVEAAIPPLKALLHIMAHGHYQGKEITDPSVRELFKRDYVLTSSWYRERLELKQSRDVANLTRQIGYLEKYISQEINQSVVTNMELQARLEAAGNTLNKARSREYLEELTGTIGADPLFVP